MISPATALVSCPGSLAALGDTHPCYLLPTAGLMLSAFCLIAAALAWSRAWLLSLAFQSALSPAFRLGSISGLLSRLYLWPVGSALSLAFQSALSPVFRLGSISGLLSRLYFWPVGSALSLALFDLALFLASLGRLYPWPFRWALSLAFVFGSISGLLGSALSLAVWVGSISGRLGGLYL